MPLDKEYLEHKVYDRIDEMIQFYANLSISVFRFAKLGTEAFWNIDSYVYSSSKGTLDSIKMVLKNGHINDSYSLLRKYYDSSIINIYSILYLTDNIGLENFIVDKINDWLKGKEKLPYYRIMSQYIRNSTKLKGINDLLYKDDRYKKIRERCNDHTHYNFYQNVLLNDNEIILSYRMDALEQFAFDIEQVFILHLSYIFYLNEHYMMSSDYTDSLDIGVPPIEGSQYFVEPFVQKTFYKFIKENRSDIAAEIKSNTQMKIE